MRVCAKLIGFPAFADVAICVESVSQGWEPGLDISLPDEATVEMLWAALAPTTPPVDFLLDKVLVDGQDADLATPLRDGGAVIFFGPAADRQ